MSQEGTCLISGRIYKFSDSLSESKPCWKCLPNDSVSDWSWGTYLSCYGCAEYSSTLLE